MGSARKRLRWIDAASSGAAIAVVEKAPPAKGRSSEEKTDEWERLLLGVAPVVESAVAVAVEMTVGATTEAASSSGARSSTDPAPSAGGALVEVPVVAAASSGPAELRLLEGCRVTIDLRPGRYERCLVTCPVHADCEAQRSCSKRFARASGLGAEEPFAFLGVWLRHAGRFETKKEHQEFKKKISWEEERAYAQEQGLTCRDVIAMGN